jgi:hypothetical protein
MRIAVAAVVSLTLLLTAQARADWSADRLADKVLKASGIENWPKVKRVKFTFNVEQDGKKIVSASHDWDLRAGTDRVVWDDKNVLVNLRNPDENADTKAAHQRWTNDSYWLLAPLKLKDPGVNRKKLPNANIDGVEYEVLELSFGNIGLTPGDKYTLYIDPKTNLYRYWDYRPSADKTVRFTWETYVEAGGLTLATEHKTGNRRIFFTDVAVEVDPK